jgi:predicted membrane protein
LFKTDTSAFIVATILAFLCVVIITWLHIFFHILVVVAAGMLVRIDTQTGKWSYRHIFWLLASSTILGLGLGALAQMLLGELLGVRV